MWRIRFIFVSGTKDLIDVIWPFIQWLQIGWLCSYSQLTVLSPYNIGPNYLHHRVPAKCKIDETKSSYLPSLFCQCARAQWAQKPSCYCMGERQELMKLWLSCPDKCLHKAFLYLCHCCLQRKKKQGKMYGDLGRDCIHVLAF